jgi:uncharacterized hydrophobic protein (TIGR00271 family)
MLISPLMGPIMGIGLGMGINDISLLKKAIYNYVVATVVALTTSTIFFLVSPLSDAHSEILARTAPNVYDVLIALFGGLAGILATSSKHKGNVIPGVAIATALMPPLCTAGYGLATFQFNFFIGAFYLYIINTVFIALATFVMIRLLEFPEKDLHDARSTRRSHRIVWGIVLLTLIPSLYFGYDIVQQDRFIKNANRFITYEAHFKNDYLLSKKIDAKEKVIQLVFGGTEIPQRDIQILKSKLPQYTLGEADLQVKQGFAYLDEDKSADNLGEFKIVSAALVEKEKEQRAEKSRLDSIDHQKKQALRVFAELKAHHPALRNAIIQPAISIRDTVRGRPTYLVVLDIPGRVSWRDKLKMEKWLKVRLQQDSLTIIYK